MSQGAVMVGRGSHSHVILSISIRPSYSSRFVAGRPQQPPSLSHLLRVRYCNPSKTSFTALGKLFMLTPTTNFITFPSHPFDNPPSLPHPFSLNFLRSPSSDARATLTAHARIFSSLFAIQTVLPCSPFLRKPDENTAFFLFGFFCFSFLFFSATKIL